MNNNQIDDVTKNVVLLIIRFEIHNNEIYRLVSNKYPLISGILINIQNWKHLEAKAELPVTVNSAINLWLCLILTYALILVLSYRICLDIDYFYPFIFFTKKKWNFSVNTKNDHEISLKISSKIVSAIFLFNYLSSLNYLSKLLF